MYYAMLNANDAENYNYGDNDGNEGGEKWDFIVEDQVINLVQVFRQVWIFEEET